MSIAASRYTKELIDKKINKGSVFTLALSGGSSPIRYYELLAEEDINWSLVKIFFVDERKVPANHVHSNFRMINRALLSKIDIPEANIISPDTEIRSVLECAMEYEKKIRKAFGISFPMFDLIVLGAGPDGHTASLFPGAENFPDQERIFISATAPPQFDVRERLTMTLSLINKANNRIFVISGEGKSEIVKRVLDHDSSIPAGMVNTDSLIFIDAPV